MSEFDVQPMRLLSIEQRVIRMAAREAVADAIRSGQLKREPCERCGAVKAEAHHDDYSKPLTVRWLCRSHHGEVHREIGAPMGRRPRAGTAGGLIAFRATDDERERWEAAAIRARSDLSSWLRSIADHVAAQAQAAAPPGAWDAAIAQARKARRARR